MGIEVENRIDTATKVQALLTDFGCFIKTRIGLHEASDEGDLCSQKGLIILEFIKNTQEKAKELEESIKELKGVVVKIMEF